MGDNVYPNEKRANRVLSIAYPNSDPELRDNLAYLVSARRCTIDQALQIMLERKDEKPGDPPVVSKTANAILQSPRASNTPPDTSEPTPAKLKPTPPAKPSTAPATTAAVNTKSDTKTKATVTAPAPPKVVAAGEKRSSVTPATRRTGSTNPVSVTKTPSSNHVIEDFYFPDGDSSPAMPRSGPTPAPTTPTMYHNLVRDGSNLSGESAARPVSPSGEGMKHFFYGDDVDTFNEQVLSQKGQVILFTTSMTGSRFIRDHSRSMETLLYVKHVPYHYVDVADNIDIQRLVREWYRRNTNKFLMPTMPLLFVDSTLIGNYEEVQELENDDMLDYKLQRAGYVAAEEVPEKPDYFAKEREAILAEARANGKADAPQSGSPVLLSATMPPASRQPKAPAKEVVLPRPSRQGGASSVNTTTTTTSSGGGTTPTRASAPAGIRSADTRRNTTSSCNNRPSAADVKEGAKDARLVTLPRSKGSNPVSATGSASQTQPASVSVSVSASGPTSRRGSGDPARRSSAATAANGTAMPTTSNPRTSVSITGASPSSTDDQKRPLQHQKLPHISAKPNATTAAASGAATRATGATTQTAAPQVEKRQPTVLSHPAAIHSGPTSIKTATVASPPGPSPPASGRSDHPTTTRPGGSFKQVQKASPPGPHRPKPAATATATTS